jgi:hypothetical protein
MNPKKKTNNRILETFLNEKKAKFLTKKEKKKCKKREKITQKIPKKKAKKKKKRSSDGLKNTFFHPRIPFF